MQRVLSLKDRVAQEFQDVWWTNCPTRYRVIFGARNTGKSHTFIGEEPVNKILRDKNRNIVFLRNVFADIKDTCFAEVQKYLFETGLFIYFQVKTHDLEIVYKKTGQKMLFMGCDRGTAINGIQVPIGEITDLYFEEAYELDSYEKFRQIDGSVRGSYTTFIESNKKYIPKQITFLLNPWSAEGCWIYDIFVKPYMQDDNITKELLERLHFRQYINEDLVIEKGIGLALHQSSYLVNHWRDTNVYDKTALNMKKKAPLIYQVEYLGMWGVSGEVVYPEFKENLVINPILARELEYSQFCIGIDTAFSNGEGKILQGEALERARIHSAYAIILCGITRRDYKGIEKGTIVAIDEYFHSQEISGVKKSQTELWEDTLKTIQTWFSKYQCCPTLFKGITYCFVDSGDAGSLSSLDQLRRNRYLGNVRFDKSTKKKISTRIRFERLMFALGKMVISSECSNLIREIKNCRQAKGKERADINDHALNAFEYGSAPLYTISKEWSNFKEYK